MKKKVLWFSRHEMILEQRAALGDVEIIQINKTVQSAYELRDEINECDIIAIVAPINLQQQFIKFSNAETGHLPLHLMTEFRLIPIMNGTVKGY